MLHAREDYQGRIQDSAKIIPEEEPVFLLRAQDFAAPAAVGFWADMAEQMGAAKNIVSAARGQADAMRQWQETQVGKVPDMPE